MCLNYPYQKIRVEFRQKTRSSFILTPGLPWETDNFLDVIRTTLRGIFFSLVKYFIPLKC